MALNNLNVEGNDVSENKKESEKLEDNNSYQILSIKEINSTSLKYDECAIRTWGK